MSNYKSKSQVACFLINKFKHNGYFFHCDYSSFHKIDKGWFRLYKDCYNYKIENNDFSSFSCSFENCANLATVGAHVRYAGSYKNTASWYIVPSCQKCNLHFSKCCKLKEGILLLKIIQGGFFKKVLVGHFDIGNLKTKKELSFNENFSYSMMNQNPVFKRKAFIENCKFRIWKSPCFFGW